MDFDLIRVSQASFVVYAGLALAAFAGIAAADPLFNAQGANVDGDGDSKTKGAVVPAESFEFEVAAQDVSDALIALGEQAGVTIMVHQDAVGVATSGVRGEFTITQALDRLLADTDLEYRLKRDAIIVSRPTAERTRRQPRNRSTLLQRAGSAISALLLAAAPAAQAVEGGETASGDGSPEADERDEQVETIIVTGTRLRLPPSQLASPVIVMDAQALADTGAANFEEVLARLPQNVNGGNEIGGASRLQIPSTTQFNGTDNVFGASTVNLRGMGSQHTLVLVNGQRLGSSGVIGGYSDVSSIPLEQIDRVEIQLDGASAVYGADAIGGVVNIILKEDYQGITIKLRYSGYTRRGSERYNASLAGTRSWATGSMTGTLTHFRRTDLAVSDSPGLRGLLDLAGRYTAAGNVAGYRDRRLDSLSELAGEDVFEVPIPAGQDGTGLMLGDFLGAGEPTSSEALESGKQTMLPARERSSFRLALRQELTDGMQLKASVSYLPNESVTTRAPSGIGVELDEDHPLNPFGQRVVVRRSSDGLPYRTIEGNNDRWALATSLQGEVLGWDWSVKANYTAEEAKTRTLNELSDARFDDAVEDGTLNVLGESLAGSNSPEVLAGLAIPLQTMDTVNGDHGVRGSLRRGFELTRAGTTQVVLGGSWRETRLEYSKMHDLDSKTYLVRPEAGLGFFPNDTGGLANSDVNLEGIEGVVRLHDDGGTIRAKRSYESLFAEAHLPVLAGQPLVQRLSFNAALRYEDADDYGSSRTWSAGAVWGLSPQVRLRARRGTSFSAPTLSQSSLPTQLATGRIFISFSPFAFLTDRTAVQGGNSALLPETATTLSYGLEFSPRFAENLRLQLNYSEADHRNKIDGVTPFFIGLFPFYHAERETRYPGVYRYDEDRDCSSEADAVGRRMCQFVGTDARAINIGTQVSAHYDLILDYRVDTRFGELSARANVTRLARFTLREGPEEDEVGLVGVSGGLPVHSQRGQLAWERGTLRVALNLSHRQRTFLDLKVDTQVDCDVWDTGDEDWWCTRTIYKNPVVADLVVRWSRENLFGVPRVQVAAGMNNIGGKQTTKEQFTPDGASIVDTEYFLSSRLLETRGKEFYVEATVTF